MLQGTVMNIYENECKLLFTFIVTSSIFPLGTGCSLLTAQHLFGALVLRIGGMRSEEVRGGARR